jgi:glucose-1-phosphate thymidylyltransferase
MIYYPISVLMLAGIRDILIISSPDDLGAFRRLLGDGSTLGVRFSYAVQAEPRGLADAFILGAEHVGGDSVALVLGDNIYHGAGFGALLRQSARDIDGCVLFGYRVREPERYGVGEIDADGNLTAIEEKPASPRSDLAITGLYLYDNEVVDIAAKLQPSARGELEITDVNRAYLERGKCRLVSLGRGFAWLDTGTPDALTEAGQFVRTLESRQGVRIACLEEIAWQMGFIDRQACYRLGEELANSSYGQYLMEVAAAG